MYSELWVNYQNEVKPSLGNGIVIFQIDATAFVLKSFKMCIHFSDSPRRINNYNMIVNFTIVNLEPYLSVSPPSMLRYSVLKFKLWHQQWTRTQHTKHKGELKRPKQMVQVLETSANKD